MLGQYSTRTLSSSDSRMFVFELEGLSENEVTFTHQSPIRHSHNQFIQVPFYRMGEEMKRINLLGGKIIDIRPLSHLEGAENHAESD